MQSDVRSTLNEMRSDMSKRETRLIVTIGGLMFAMFGVAVAILGILIRLPN